MKCTDFFRRARAYMENQLGEDEMDACAAHERDCPSCGKVMTIARETTCHDLAEFLDDYVSGSLPEAQRAIFERHLSLCGECQSYLDGYTTTIDLARGVTCEPETEMGPDCGMPEGLVQAILAARTGGQDRSGSEQDD